MPEHKCRLRLARPEVKVKNVTMADEELLSLKAASCCTLTLAGSRAREVF